LESIWPKIDPIYQHKTVNHSQHFVDPDTGVSNSKYQMSAEKYLRNYTSTYIIVNNPTFRPLSCKIHVKKKAFDTHEQLDDFFLM